jgi:hypothetical protein
MPAATGAPFVPRSFLSGRWPSCDFSARTLTARIRRRNPMMAEKAARFIRGCFMFSFLVHDMVNGYYPVYSDKNPQIPVIFAAFPG